MTAPLAPVPASPPNQALAENHRQFLAFLRRRVDNDATAEDILQDAYAKSLAKIDEVRNEENVVAWFYRVLRNALIDHYRRRGIEKTAYEHLERDAESSFEPELRQNICTCVSAILPSLKPEYAEMVNAVELGDRPIVDVARERGSRRTTPRFGFIGPARRSGAAWSRSAEHAARTGAWTALVRRRRRRRGSELRPRGLAALSMLQPADERPACSLQSIAMIRS